MQTKHVVAHYGSRPAVARVLKISRQAVEKWGTQVPELRAFQLQKITRGKLRA